MDNKKFCKFCGEEIDKEAIVCTKCGKQLKTIKNEQKEIKEEPVNTVQENTKFYTQTWFMWFMLIFFAPLGILFMWKFHPEMKNKTKTIITIVFALLFLIVVFNMGDTEETTTKDLNVTNNQEKTEDTSKKIKITR